MLRLFHCSDTRSLRCLWAIHEMGLEHRVAVEAMPFPPSRLAPEYLEINPQGTVPTLLDDGLVMTESVAILQYLTARFGPTPLAVAPDEPEYGTWLDWLLYGEATLLAFLVVIIHSRFAEHESLKVPQIEEEYGDLFLKRLERVEAALSGRDYLCASRLTTADISVGYALDVACFLGFAESLPPLVKAYIDRLRKTDSYRAARRAQKMLMEARQS